MSSVTLSFSDEFGYWARNLPTPGNWSTVAKGRYALTGYKIYEPDTIPRYRNLIRAHQSATTAFTGYFQQVLKGGNDGFISSSTTSGPKTTQEVRGCLQYNTLNFGSTAAPAKEISASLINGVKTSFVSKASSAVSALQGLVSAGEFGENLRLIHGSSKSLARGIDNYLKGIGPFGRKVNAAKRLKILADRWLEYSFGWKPLINELDSAAHAVSNIVNYRMPTEQILAQGSTTENISSIKVQRSSGSGCRWECDSRTYWEFGFKLYGVVFLQHGTSPSSIQTNLGVTMSDFVPALWELIPYSFLVDYFTNVGSILSAWSFNTSNLAWHAQGSAVRLNCVSTVSFRDPLPGNVRLPTSVPGSPLHVARTYLTRLPGSLAGFVPSLGFKIPGIGSTKWLNIAALATGHSEAVKRASRM